MRLLEQDKRRTDSTWKRPFGFGSAVDTYVVFGPFMTSEGISLTILTLVSLPDSWQENIGKNIKSKISSILQSLEKKVPKMVSVKNDLPSLGCIAHSLSPSLV